MPHLEELLDNDLKYTPVANQIEYNPYLSSETNISRKVVDYCKNKDILIEAYGSLVPLGDSGDLDNLLVALARKYGVSKASILQRYILDQDMIVVTTSKKLARIDSYPEMFSFSLTKEEVETLTKACENENENRRSFWTGPCAKLS